MSSDTTTPNWTVTPTSGLQINSTAFSGSGQNILTGTSAEYDTSSDFAVYYYTTDGSSPTQEWKDPLGDNVQQGVFWVAVSGDGNYGAAGGEYGSGRGFLRTYNLSQGAGSRQEFDYTSRINEVEISEDGSAIVAVESSNLQFFTLSNNQYGLAATENISGAYLRSCCITPDGRYLAVAGEVYSDGETYSCSKSKEESSSSTGILYLYENVGGALSYLGHLP